MQAVVFLDLYIYLGIDEIVFGQGFSDSHLELAGSQALGDDRADEGGIDSALGRYGQRQLMLFLTTRIDCDGQNIVGPDPIGLTLGSGLGDEYQHDKLAQKQKDISWFYLFHKNVKYNNWSGQGLFAEKLPFTTYGVTKFQV